MLQAFFACVLEQFVSLEAIGTFLLAARQVDEKVVLDTVAEVQQVLPVELELPAHPGRAFTLGEATEDEDYLAGGL